jgi:hypothetical protein
MLLAAASRILPREGVHRDPSRAASYFVLTPSAPRTGSFRSQLPTEKRPANRSRVSRRCYPTTAAQTRCDDFCTPQAVLLTLYAVIVVIAWMVAGEEERWLRLDDEGMTLRGHRIPWEAVMSARWAFDAAGTKPRGGIELFLRGVGAYQPPRSGRVSIAPAAFRIPPNVLLDMIVRYARPRTVYVLPPRRRPIGRNEM